MAYTTEQQSQLDMQLAIQADSAAKMAVQDAKRARLELIRLAKETLIENARNKAVDEREISAADITTFATTLEGFVNS
jgi:hypothetical protein